MYPFAGQPRSRAGVLPSPAPGRGQSFRFHERCRDCSRYALRRPAFVREMICSPNSAGCGFLVPGMPPFTIEKAFVKPGRSDALFDGSRYGRETDRGRASLFSRTPASVRTYRLNRRPQPVGDELDVRSIADIGWREEDVVAIATVGRAPHRKNEQAPLHAGIADLRRFAARLAIFELSRDATIPPGVVQCPDFSPPTHMCSGSWRGGNRLRSSMTSPQAHRPAAANQRDATTRSASAARLSRCRPSRSTPPARG